MPHANSADSEKSTRLSDLRQYRIPTNTHTATIIIVPKPLAERPNRTGVVSAAQFAQQRVQIEGIDGGIRI